MLDRLPWCDYTVFMKRQPERQHAELDTKVDIVTPENIRFSYRLAGPMVRMFAFLFDLIFMIVFAFCVFFALSFVISYVTSFVDSPTEFVIRRIFMCLCLIFYFLLFWFGMAYFEARFNGLTPGKSLFRLRVITVDGLPISALQAFLRNVIRMADIAIGPITVLMMLSNERFMRFGDVAAGTIVVFTDQESAGHERIHFDGAEYVKLVKSIPVTFSVSDDLAKVLGLYVSRRSALTPQRRTEIAGPLAFRLMERAGISSKVDPDIFLCALYQWNLEERSIG